MRTPDYFSNNSLEQLIVQDSALEAQLRTIQTQPTIQHITQVLPKIRTIASSIGKPLIPALLLSLQACTQNPHPVAVQASMDNVQTAAITEAQQQIIDLSTQVALLAETVEAKERENKRLLDEVRTSIADVISRAQTSSQQVSTHLQGIYERLNGKASNERVTAISNDVKNQDSKQQSLENSIQAINTSLTTTKSQLRDEVQQSVDHLNSKQTELRSSVLTILEQLPSVSTHLVEGQQQEITELQAQLSHLMARVENGEYAHGMDLVYVYEYINGVYDELYRFSQLLQQNTSNDISFSVEVSQTLIRLQEQIVTLETQLQPPPTPSPTPEQQEESTSDEE